jgi:hypothetical protein
VNGLAIAVIELKRSSVELADGVRQLITNQEEVFELAQARETPRQFVERKSHYLWGRRYLLSVVARDARPFVRLSHRRITLFVRPGSDSASATPSCTRGTRR